MGIGNDDFLVSRTIDESKPCTSISQIEWVCLFVYFIKFKLECINKNFNLFLSGFYHPTNWSVNITLVLLLSFMDVFYCELSIAEETSNKYVKILSN